MMEYSGQGKCREVRCWSDNVPIYREHLRTWATSNNWTVTIDYLDRFDTETLQCRIYRDC